MSDIFLSYAGADRAQAERCATLLEQQGWSVWWDRSIPAGRTFDRVIEEQLAQARCVVVLWSAASVQSDWVRTEAADGARRGILVPVIIEKVDIPLEFRRIQAADLAGWRGDPAGRGFRFLCASIAGCLGGGAVPSPTAPRRTRTGLALGALAAGLGLAAAVGLMLRPHHGDRQAATALHSIGAASQGCEAFEDPPELVARGPITRIDLYHMGLIHGIRVWYGGSAGTAHGFTGDREYHPTESSWVVPDDDAITRVEGAMQGRYVSRLRFFTRRGQASPPFGVEGGAPFSVGVPAPAVLRSVGGSAVRTRGKDVNRALCSLSLRFAAP